MYFIFKGIKSTEMGVTVLTQPPIKSPESRTWNSFIDNKDGADSLFLGYKPIELSMEIAVEGKENLDKVLGWLDGEGQLIRSDFPDRYRNVHIVEGIELNMINPELWQGSLTYLVVDPYWYKVGDEWAEVGGENLTPRGWDSYRPAWAEGDLEKAPVEIFNLGYRRNLIRGTDDLTNFWHGYRGSEVTYEKGRPIRGNESVRVTLTPNDGSSHTWGVWTTSGIFSMEFGEDYTFSMYIRNVGKNPVRLNMNGLVGYKVTGDFSGTTIESGAEGRFVVTGRRREDYDWFQCLIATTGVRDDNISIEVSKMQVVEGDIPGDWVPHWDDLDKHLKPASSYANLSYYVEKITEDTYRYRSRGGNKNTVGVIPFDREPESSCTVEMIVRNIGVNPIEIRNHKAYIAETVGPGETKYLNIYGENYKGAASQISIRTVNVGDILDVVVSNPHVVEGRSLVKSITEYDYVQSIEVDDTIISPKGNGSYMVKFSDKPTYGKVRYSANFILNGSSVKKSLALISGREEKKIYIYHEVSGSEFHIEGDKDISSIGPVDWIAFYKGDSYAESVNNESIILDLDVKHTSPAYKVVEGNVVNKGNTKSYPIIHLKNNSKDTNVVRLNINDSIIRYEFPQGETEVFINLMGMRAGTEPTHTGYYRHDVRDKYLYVERDKGMHLNPGPNTITSDGDVEIKLLRKDRWI